MPSNPIGTHQNRHLLSKLTTLVLSGTLASCASTNNEIPISEGIKIIAPSESNESIETYQGPEDITPQRYFPPYFELSPAPGTLIDSRIRLIEQLGRAYRT